MNAKLKRTVQSNTCFAKKKTIANKIAEFYFAHSYFRVQTINKPYWETKVVIDFLNQYNEGTKKPNTVKDIFARFFAFVTKANLVKKLKKPLDPAELKKVYDRETRAKVARDRIAAAAAEKQAVAKMVAESFKLVPNSRRIKKMVVPVKDPVEICKEEKETKKEQIIAYIRKLHAEQLVKKAEYDRFVAETAQKVREEQERHKRAIAEFFELGKKHQTIFNNLTAKYKQNVKKQEKDLAQELLKTPENPPCGICMEPAYEVIASPCMHACCHGCWTALRAADPRYKCPFCRGDITSFAPSFPSLLPVYFVAAPPRPIRPAGPAGPVGPAGIGWHHIGAAPIRPQPGPRRVNGMSTPYGGFSQQLTNAFSRHTPDRDLERAIQNSLA